MYQIELDVKDEHIDFRGIVDGLYYPYYLEETRHKFIKEVLGVDIQQAAKEGTNWVLAEYTLKFRASLKKNDKISVTCLLMALEGSRSKFGFSQAILRDGKPVAEASFVATCVLANGGRPFIPEVVSRALSKQMEPVSANQ